MRQAVLGTVTPTVPGLKSPSVVRCVTGLSSVMPYPCTTSHPMRAPASSARSALNGAAPENTWRRVLRSNCSTIGCLASARTIGGTARKRVTRCSWINVNACSRSNRGIVTTVTPRASMPFMSTCIP